MFHGKIYIFVSVAKVIVIHSALPRYHFALISFLKGTTLSNKNYILRIQHNVHLLQRRLLLLLMPTTVLITVLVSNQTFLSIIIYHNFLQLCYSGERISTADIM